MAFERIRRSSRRLKISESFHNMTSVVPLKKSRRTEVETIDDVVIYTFEDVLQNEYFTNLEEPLPRKQRPFRGFDDADDRVNIIKHYFDRFVENFSEMDSLLLELNEKKTPKKNKDRVLNRKSESQRRKRPRSRTSNNYRKSRNFDQDEEVRLIEDKWDTIEEISQENKGSDDADESAAKAANDSVEEINVPIEIITISDNESDDDCVMISDPTAPIPRPVAPACCPTCGKYKGTARKSESDRDSALGDEISVITDGSDSPPKADESLSGYVKGGSNPRSETLTSVGPVVVESSMPPIPKQYLGKSPAHDKPFPKPPRAEMSRTKISTCSSLPVGAVDSSLPAISKQCSTNNYPAQENTETSSTEIPTRSSLPENTAPRLLDKNKLYTSSNHCPRILKRKSAFVQPQNDSSVDCEHSPISHTQPLTLVVPPGVVPSKVHRPITNTPEASSARFTSAISPETKEIPVSPLTERDDIPKVQLQSSTQANSTSNQSLTAVEKAEGETPIESDNLCEISPVGSTSERIPPANLTALKSLIKPPTSPPVPVIRSELSKPVVSKLDGSKSKMLSRANPPQAEIPSPLKMCCKSTKHPNFIHYLRDDGKQCDDQSSVDEKSNFPLVDIGRPKITSSPSVYHVGITNALLNGSKSQGCRVLKPVVKPAQSSGTALLHSGLKVLRPVSAFGNSKAGSSNVAVDAEVKSIVRDIVDFVCRKEKFPVSSSPMSEVPIEKTEKNSVTSSLTLRSLALLNGSKSQGCRVLKPVVKPTHSPGPGTAVLHSGLKVLRPVSAFGNSKAGSSNLAVDAEVKSVVGDIVDFVCRKEKFPVSFPYDSTLTAEKPCLLAPCGNDHCWLGCLCVSLSKKSVRRVRCRNVECVFQCECDSLKKGFQNRIATTSANRRKQILGSVSEADRVPEAPAFSDYRTTVDRYKLHACSTPSNLIERTSSSSAPSTPAVTASVSKYSPTIAVPKPATYCCTHVEPPIAHSTPSKPTSFSSAPPWPTSKQLVFSSKPSTKPSSKLPSLPEPPKPSELPVPTRRYFGREKVPIPEQALICLTPGVGYVPLEEYNSTKVTVRDPFQTGKTKGFLNVRQATDWLNSTIQRLLTRSELNLRWMVANKTMIETKQLRKLNIETLKTLQPPAIAQKGAICLL